MQVERRPGNRGGSLVDGLDYLGAVVGRATPSVIKGFNPLLPGNAQEVAFDELVKARKDRALNARERFVGLGVGGKPRLPSDDGRGVKEQWGTIL